jgi:indole-3-glycerol phosphate synthase
MARDAEPPRGFLSALKRAKGTALIAEVKKASPSKGVIRKDFEASVIANSYERAGAHCLSVLTDEQFFLGSSDNLVKAKATVKLPCLRKDFIEDPAQVYYSRAIGADAILLIASWLGPVQLQDLHGLATELGMDALVEVHDEKEFEMLAGLGIELVGVNNRNLTDFSENLSNSYGLIPKVSENHFAVAESSIETHGDVEHLARSGAKAVLIGTTFCAAMDIEAKVKEVMGWQLHV